MGLLRRIERGSAPTSSPGPSAPPTPGTPRPPEGAPTFGAPSSAPPPRIGVAAPARPGQTQILRDLKTRVKGKLISELDPNMDLTKTNEVRMRIKLLFDQIVEAENIV